MSLHYFYKNIIILFLNGVHTGCPFYLVHEPISFVLLEAYVLREFRASSDLHLSYIVNASRRALNSAKM